MGAKASIIWVAALAALLMASDAVAQPRADRVRTEAGQVEGLGVQASGVRIFRGVPYAQAPVGDLRWREPQRPRRWRGVRQAKEFANGCMQQRIFDDMVFRYAGVSEDCLYLNIWTPATSPRERLPVLLYIYGGGFIAGDSSEFRYDGEALAARGIIVVSMNYRLGVFGFMAHPELTAESPHHASGNYGLLDQVAALQWVQRNIERFGGDPNRIIVGGESAGSASAHALMASPLSRQLIAGAIGESGSFMGRWTLPRAEAEQNGLRFGQSIGAPSLDALRALSGDDLMARAGAPEAPRFGGIIDGYLFPKHPREIFEAGEQAHVPLLAGSNSAEGSAGQILEAASPSVANYRAALTRLYGENGEALFQHYPAEADGTAVLDAAQDLASDRFTGLNTWQWLDAAARTGAAPTFYYFYTHPRPAPRAGWNANRARGAVHSGEIEYALGNLETNEVYAWTDEDRAVSETMQRYFVNFVKTGDPNGEGVPAWYTFDSGWRQIIDVETRAEADRVRARYEFLQGLAQ